MKTVVAMLVLIAAFFANQYTTWARDNPATNQLIRQAYAKYADQEFEEALSILGKASKRKANSKRQLVKLYHLMGLCFGTLGKPQAAQMSFARALALDPAFRLGSNVSPKIRKPFIKLLRKHPKPLEVRVKAPAFARSTKPLVMTVSVLSNPTKLAKSVKLGFRRGGTGKFSFVRTKLKGKKTKHISIPSTVWEGGQGWKGATYWFAVVEGSHGSILQKIGDSLTPYSTDVRSLGDNSQVIAGPKDSSWYQKWWVWTIIGGVVAAGATTAAVLANPSEQSGPASFSLEFSNK